MRQEAIHSGLAHPSDSLTEIEPLDDAVDAVLVLALLGSRRAEQVLENSGVTYFLISQVLY